MDTLHISQWQVMDILHTLSGELRISYTYLSDKLRIYFTKLRDKLWTPKSINLSIVVMLGNAFSEIWIAIKTWNFFHACLDNRMYGS